MDIDTLFAVIGNVNALRTVALHVNLNLELIFVVEYLFWVSDPCILKKFFVEGRKDDVTKLVLKWCHPL